MGKVEEGRRNEKLQGVAPLPFDVCRVVSVSLSGLAVSDAIAF